MKMIYVCSPLREDPEHSVSDHIRFARLYSSWVAELGHVPVAPHILFTQFLDDRIPEERKMGIDMGKEILARCDELWVFGDHISEGMKAEIDLARRIGIPVQGLDPSVVLLISRAIRERRTTIHEKAESEDRTSGHEHPQAEQGHRQQRKARAVNGSTDTSGRSNRTKAVRQRRPSNEKGEHTMKKAIKKPVAKNAKAKKSVKKTVVKKNAKKAK